MKGFLYINHTNSLRSWLSLCSNFGLTVAATSEIHIKLASAKYPKSAGIVISKSCLISGTQRS